MAQRSAARAAGDREVLLPGAGTARHCLRAGPLDALEIHVLSVLLGCGRRLFAHRSFEDYHVR